MDDRSNTIAGWVLFAGISALGLSVVTGEYFHAERPEKMGYTVEGVEAEGGGDTAAAAELPIETYLAKADPAKGADVFKKCGACHTDQKGGPNGIGPQLWDVVGRPRASEAGFAYSDALKGRPGSWDWDTLGEWLKSPKAFAPGTKMTFAGLSNPQDRGERDRLSQLAERCAQAAADGARRGTGDGGQGRGCEGGAGRWQDSARRCTGHQRRRGEVTSFVIPAKPGSPSVGRSAPLTRSQLSQG